MYTSTPTTRPTEAFMQNIVFVVILLLIGMALRLLAKLLARNPRATRWIFAVPSDLAESLTSFAIYVSLPALILVQIPKLSVSAELLVPMLMPWVMLFVSAGLVWAASALFQWSRATKGLLLLLVPLGNTSFLGIPMVEAFFGSEYVEYALLYDQVGTFLALATYGAVISAVFGARTRDNLADPKTTDTATSETGASAAEAQDESRQVDDDAAADRPSIAIVLLKIAFFPPFAALVLAFATRNLSYPEQLVSMLERLGATLIPLVMVAVAFKIELRLRQQHRLPLAVGLSLKLVVAPLIALAGCYLFDLHSPVANVSVFEAGMPPQISAWAVAMKARLEPELGAAMVGVGILLSFGTLSGLYALL